MLIFSPDEKKHIFFLFYTQWKNLGCPFRISIEYKIKRKFAFSRPEKKSVFPWSFLVRFGFCSVFTGYTIGCKHSLHLENGLESYFNE